MVQTEKKVEDKIRDNLSTCTKSVFENKENIVHVDQYSSVDEISRLRLSEEIDDIILDTHKERLSPNLSPKVFIFYIFHLFKCFYSVLFSKKRKREKFSIFNPSPKSGAYWQNLFWWKPKNIKFDGN